MNRYLLILGIVFSSTASAEGTRFRANDPFLFCHEGLNTPDPCWKPAPPYTGAFTLNWECNLPNTESERGWTIDESQSFDDYLRICPQAIKSGEWDSKGGAADTTPFVH